MEEGFYLPVVLFFPLAYKGNPTPLSSPRGRTVLCVPFPWGFESLFKKGPVLSLFSSGDLRLLECTLLCPPSPPLFYKSATSFFLPSSLEAMDPCPLPPPFPLSPLFPQTRDNHFPPPPPQRCAPRPASPSFLTECTFPLSKVTERDLFLFPPAEVRRSPFFTCAGTFFFSSAYEF